MQCEENEITGFKACGLKVSGMHSKSPVRFSATQFASLTSRPASARVCLFRCDFLHVFLGKGRCITWQDWNEFQ